MINKRRLINNIISHNDECTFFDKKESIDLKTEKGKTKFLKHVCALSNSNPGNDSFLLVGISNNNDIIGTGFIDDADVQNVIASGLNNPPSIKYENISFPNLDKKKSIGILTIHPSQLISSFSKSSDSIKAGSIYHRIGSKSEPINGIINVIKENKSIIEKTYIYSQNSIKDLLDNVFEFFDQCSDAYYPKYFVFKEQFVVCWSGYPSGNGYFNELDIQFINEGTRLFFSAIKDVKISVTEEAFNIIEFQNLGYGNNYNDRPVYSTTIFFHDNGTYKIQKEFIFKPPKYPFDEIESLYNQAKEIERKCLAKEILDEKDWEFWEGIGNYFFICYLNGIKEAKQDFLNSPLYLDGVAAHWHRQCNDLLEEYEKILS